MARSIWSGFLSFGLVNVPVGLYPATADQTVHFNQLHKGTSHRIRYKKVDEVTGEEVPTADIVSGYDLGGGEYVIVARDELKDIAAGKSETIEISDFVDLAEIDPVHYRQTYYLAPRGKSADRAYALLRQAMDETGKVGIATMVLRDKEHLVAVRPGVDVLILETMYFADEIRNPKEELDTLPTDASFRGRELDVAKKLVESLTVGWVPEDYHNTYRERVMELIDRKREGKAVVFEEERPKSNVIDLMAALEASVARMGQGGAADGGEQAEEPAREARGGRRAGRGRDGSGNGRAHGGQVRSGPGRGGPSRDGSGNGRAGAAKEAQPSGTGQAGAAGEAQPSRTGRSRPDGAADGQQDLARLSKADLLAHAAELEIPGRSKMSKPELIEAITAAGGPRRSGRKIS